jgi:RNA polymerase sigma-70 factor (ECF subfamily)
VELTGKGLAGRAAERAARQSYGRLLAYLVRAWRDVAAVEDALAEAFTRALVVWPRDGVPDNPDGWLLVAARNKLLDGARSAAVRQTALASLKLTTAVAAEDPPMIPDKRLELMFVCAHPDIDPAVHTALMLQCVLGLSAERIGSSFLVSPDAMGRRLSRAKARIRDAGTGFEVPDASAVAGRLGAVMEAIYAAYGQGWDSIASDDAGRKGLSEEAIWLARALVSVAPGDAEPRGLLALMLFCEARAKARRADLRYVPLADQQVDLWDREMIAAAERALAAAGAMRAPGRFQLEAAIQSAMVQSRLTSTDLRVPLLRLHGALVSVAPTLGNRLGWIAALSDVDGPQAGLKALDELPHQRIRSYQPYWAVRAHLLGRAGAGAGFIDEAFSNAIGLSTDAATRAYLIEKRAMLTRQ